METEPYVDARTIAAHLGQMSYLTVIGWAKVGKIPATKPGQKWLFKISEVEESLKPTDLYAQSPQSRAKRRAT